MAGCWPVHCSWQAQKAVTAGAGCSSGKEAVVCELPAYRGTRRGCYSSSLMNAGQSCRVDHTLKHILSGSSQCSHYCALPFEAAVYGTDTACEILVCDVLEARQLHAAGKGPLVWKLSDALHKILIACLVIGHHPASSMLEVTAAALQKASGTCQSGKVQFRCQEMTSSRLFMRYGQRLIGADLPI